MTLEAWVRPTAQNGWQTVVQKEQPAGLAYSLYSYDGAPGDPSGTDLPAGYVRIGFIDEPIRGAAPLALNTWTHLAVTYDGSVLNMYVNGQLVATRAQSGSIVTSSSPLRIGGNSVFGEYFVGLIDDVRVYNRALTASEIQTDMASPVQ
jgi:hypothetical protein